MRYRLGHLGLTLMETLLAIVIVIILTSMVLTVAVRTESHSKENLARGLMATINTALAQFCDCGYQYKIRSAATDDEVKFYHSLKFPLDCNGFDIADLRVTLENALDRYVVFENINGHLNEYSGSETLYFFLSRVPQCRETLQSIDASLLTDKDPAGQAMRVIIDNRDYPLIRIIDPWGTPLNYDYYDESMVLSADFDDAAETIRTFPQITSAGPDRIFGTPDDITNREKTKSAKKL